MERIYRHKIMRSIIVKALIGQVRDPSGSVQLLLITVPKALRSASQSQVSQLTTRAMCDANQNVENSAAWRLMTITASEFIIRLI